MTKRGFTNRRSRLKILYIYTGAAFIASKFTPRRADDEIPPSGALWLVSIYVAMFGIAHQIYHTELAEVRRHWDEYQVHEVGKHSLVQTDSIRTHPKQLERELKKCRGHRDNLRIFATNAPNEPSLLSPISTFKTIFGDSILIFDTTDPARSSAIEKALEYAGEVTKRRYRSPCPENFDALVNCSIVRITNYCKVGLRPTSSDS